MPWDDDTILNVEILEKEVIWSQLPCRFDWDIGMDIEIDEDLLYKR